MATTQTSTLLSRISYAAGSSNLPQAVPTTRKRNVPDEEESRPPKRPALAEKQLSVEEEGLGFAPWLNHDESMGPDASREELLHHELVAFVEYISPSKHEREARTMLVSRIEALLKTRWPDVQLVLFGSSATGLELTGGDVDLVVSFGSQNLLEQEKKRRLGAMGDLLRKSGMTRWVNRIFGARVPIITFATTAELGEVSVDISIRNDEDSGPRAIPVIKQFLDDLPASRTLILAIKAFLSLRDLNDASQNTLSSYAITLLCISFLQRNPCRRPQELLDDPYANKSFGTLLIDFFRHYGHDFSYATHYISVSNKGTFAKKSKGWEPKGSSTAFLAVQCVLNPENNITRGCQKIALIVEAFKEAQHILQNTSIQASPEESSLLSYIYEITEEDDARRRSLEASVESGAFAQAVAACTAIAGGRAVSGGVPLASRSGARINITHYRGNSRPPMRLGPGPAQVPSLSHSSHGYVHSSNNQQWPGPTPVVQQLPVLRWQDDRAQQWPGQRLPSTQFEFESQPHHFQNMRMNYNTQAQVYPVQHYINGNGHGHRNGYSGPASYNVPQQRWNAGQSHGGWR